MSVTAMSTHQVHHTSTHQTYTRESVHISSQSSNKSTGPHWTTSDWQAHFPLNPSIEAFHKTLPDYNQTNLHSLPILAQELGLKHLFLKDESHRFGLPAFKILGASWAGHKALCQHLSLSAEETSLTELSTTLHERQRSHNDSNTNSNSILSIVTCTEGNWGRAVARTCKYLSIPVRVYVPEYMHTYTRDLIRAENADLRVVKDGKYNDTMLAVQRDAAETGAIIVQDAAWEGYTEIPSWVTDGYSTMLHEADRQIAAQGEGLRANLAIAAVGVGSWAQAVVTHYKSTDAERNVVVSVEPDTAAALKESLFLGEMTMVETGNTIMAGMNGAEPSLTAWPYLQRGTDIAVAVTDREAHEDVLYLKERGILAGPCGAATLAALRKICGEGKLEDKENTVCVLFSTEGAREYTVPT